MSFDLKLFGRKLERCRGQLKMEVSEVAAKTGISNNRILDFEAGTAEPSGSEVLILADVFKQDYHFFISNEQKTAIDQVDILYRKFGSEISKEDRWAIQEFIFLCECEEFVLKDSVAERVKFKFQPEGTFYKQHGYDAAETLRKTLGLSDDRAIPDIYSQIRRIGFHVFRRRLVNSSISGLFIRHPYAGQCILVNYNEDIFRQNFTVAHETAHAILDSEDDVNISFDQDSTYDKKEVRANSFASAFLVPKSLIDKIWAMGLPENIIYETALKLKVNPQVLNIALNRNGKIPPEKYQLLSKMKIPRDQKEDPELLNHSKKIADAKKQLLQRGLSSFYVRSCHDAYSRGLISANRMAEMLLTSDTELPNLLSLFSLQLRYDH